MATGIWGQLVRRWWIAVLLLIFLITAAALAWNASPARKATANEKNSNGNGSEYCLPSPGISR